MTPFEFLSRISFFSILSWSFFLIAVICAIVLTNFHNPLVRKYRSTLLSIAFSGLALGAASWSTPFLLRQINPDQSRMTPIDQLTITQWVEPVSNPTTSENSSAENAITPDEIGWAKKLGFKFKYKMGFQFEFEKLIASYDSTLVVLDKKGSLRGFNAYSGLNHWQINLDITQFVSRIQLQKKLFILDRNHQLDILRITCLDLQNPSVLWQRTIPNSRDGAMQIDLDNQNLIVSSGTNGIWALRSKTGEIGWKRPEIYSKIQTTIIGKQALAFEPSVMKRAGSWYFLDLLSGNTQQKVLHVYPDLGEAKSLGSIFVARVGNEQLFALNLPSLNPLWSFNLLEKPAFYEILSTGSYFVFYDSQSMEKRSIEKNELEWQKKFSNIDPRWIRFSADRSTFALPTSTDQSIAFYDTETGEYKSSAVASEPIVDFTYFGDWMYVFSEGRMWAYQK
ncbi:MAG: PQQ-binding-like beta-propeller repeat protein [Bdellovibrionales bacterium]|nr:PQQ-binding-like beta-propeller repeat protein [Bdellovibrionales bacterium]